MLFNKQISGAILLFVLACGAALAQPALPAFDHDHRDYGALLGQYVSEEGLVDYQGLLTQRAVLDDYVNMLGALPPVTVAKFSPDQRLAFYINAYNAFTLRLVLDHYPLESVQDIENAWTDKNFVLLGEKLSLDALLNRRIRGQFNEPLIHFALNRASKGSPPLGPEAWVATHINQKLVDAARSFAIDPARFELDREAKSLSVSKLLEWYGEDFVLRWGGTSLPPGPDEPVRHRAVIGYYLEFGDEDTAAFLREHPVSIEYHDYDWSLNAKQERASSSAAGDE